MLERRAGKGSELSELTSIGFPFHGVARDGVLTLGGGNGTVTFPDLVPASGDLSGGVFRGLETHPTVVRNPNRALPTRTAAQQTDDAAAGREYRDYGVAGGRHVNGLRYHAGESLTSSIYFDSQGYPWRVDLSALTHDVGTDTLSGDVVFRRMLTLSTTMQETTVTVAVSHSPAGLAQAGDLGGVGVQLHDSAGVCVADQTEAGDKVLLVPRGQLAAASGVAPLDIKTAYPLAVWELTITDAPQPGYPRGGAIQFGVAVSNQRTFASVRDAVTFSHDHTITRGQRRWMDSGGFGEYVWFRDADPPPATYQYSWYLSLDVSASLTLTGRLLSVYYDAAGVYEELTVDVTGSWTASTSITETGGESDAAETGSYDLTASASGTLTVEVRRGGVADLSRTATYGASGGESWTFESADVSASGDFEVTNSSTGGYTLDLDGSYNLSPSVSSGFDWEFNLTRGLLVFMISDEIGHSIADQITGDPPAGPPVQAVLNYHTAQQAQATEYETLDVYGFRQFYSFCPCVLATAELAAVPAWHLDAFRQFDQNNTNIVRGWFEVGDVSAPDGTTTTVARPGPDGGLDFDTSLLAQPYHFDGQPALWQPETRQWATASWLTGPPIGDARYEHLAFV